jgi:hypothetical protein
MQLKNYRFSFEKKMEHRVEIESTTAQEGKIIFIRPTNLLSLSLSLSLSGHGERESRVRNMYYIYVSEKNIYPYLNYTCV